MIFGTLIDVRRLRFPKRGRFVFIGVYYHVGTWIRFTRPSRIAWIYNTLHLELLEARIRQLYLDGKRKVELVFASASLREQTGLPGIVSHGLAHQMR
jgi:hypothetical protein